MWETQTYTCVHTHTRAHTHTYTYTEHSLWGYNTDRDECVLGNLSEVVRDVAFSNE